PASAIAIAIARGAAVLIDRTTTGSVPSGRTPRRAAQRRDRCARAPARAARAPRTIPSGAARKGRDEHLADEVVDRAWGVAGEALDVVGGEVRPAGGVGGAVVAHDALHPLVRTECAHGLRDGGRRDRHVRDVAPERAADRGRDGGVVDARGA